MVLDEGLSLERRWLFSSASPTSMTLAALAGNQARVCYHIGGPRAVCKDIQWTGSILEYSAIENLCEDCDNEASGTVNNQVISCFSTPNGSSPRCVFWNASNVSHTVNLQATSVSAMAVGSISSTLALVCYAASPAIYCIKSDERAGAGLSASPTLIDYVTTSSIAVHSVRDGMAVLCIATDELQCYVLSVDVTRLSQAAARRAWPVPIT